MSRLNLTHDLLPRSRLGLKTTFNPRGPSEKSASSVLLLMSEAVIEVKGLSTSAESSLLNSSENIRGDFYNLMQVSLFEIAWFSHRQGQRTKDYFKIWGEKLGSSLNSLTVARGGTSKLSVICYLKKASSLERAPGSGELGDGNSAARFDTAARLLLQYAKEVRQNTPAYRPRHAAFQLCFRSADAQPRREG
jgi:hypothetical protein